MKKLFIIGMLSIIGLTGFNSCAASKATRKKQEEAQKQAEKEAGNAPEFDEKGNPIEKKP